MSNRTKETNTCVCGLDEAGRQEQPSRFLKAAGEARQGQFVQVSRPQGLEARAGVGCCKDSHGLKLPKFNCVVYQVGGKVKIFRLYRLNCLLVHGVSESCSHVKPFV